MQQEASGYRNLQVYERSYKAALAVYAMTKSYPEEEKYGLTSQMRRACTSIPLNIAEGYAELSRAYDKIGRMLSSFIKRIQVG